MALHYGPPLLVPQERQPAADPAGIPRRQLPQSRQGRRIKRGDEHETLVGGPFRVDRSWQETRFHAPSYRGGRGLSKWPPEPGRHQCKAMGPGMRGGMESCRARAHPRPLSGACPPPYGLQESLLGITA